MSGCTAHIRGAILAYNYQICNPNYITNKKFQQKMREMQFIPVEPIPMKPMISDAGFRFRSGVFQNDEQDLEVHCGKNCLGECTHHVLKDKSGAVKFVNFDRNRILNNPEALNEINRLFSIICEESDLNISTEIPKRNFLYQQNLVSNPEANGIKCLCSEEAQIDTKNRLTLNYVESPKNWIQIEPIPEFQMQNGWINNPDWSNQLIGMNSCPICKMSTTYNEQQEGLLSLERNKEITEGRFSGNECLQTKVGRPKVRKSQLQKSKKNSIKNVL